MNNLNNIYPDQSYQELALINKINQAIMADEDVKEIAKNFLNVIGPVFSIKSSRVYSFDDEDQKLTLLAENFEKGRLKVIQDTIGVNVEDIIPSFSSDNYLFNLTQQKNATITSDPVEIRKIMESHTDSLTLKKFVDWAAKTFNLKTFGVVPLHIGEKLIGLITFASTKTLTESEKESIIRCTDHVSIGFTKKIVEEKFKNKSELLLQSEKLGKIGSWEVYFKDEKDWGKNTTIWSDEAYRIFGYEPNSVKVSYSFFLEHVHPDDKYLVSGNFEHLFIPGFQHETEYRIILKDGTVKYILGRFYVVFDKKKHPLKLVGMSQDITDRKQLELELENYNKNLKKEIEQQTLQLTIANKNLNAFNYSISHDLRTPLRGIEIFTDLMMDDMKNDPVKLTYMKAIKNGLDEMKNMISSLLDFAKYGEIDLKKEQLDMNTEINECIHQLTSGSYCPTLEFKISDTPALFSDKTLIRNVLSNLIGNAIKYSSKKEHSCIEINGFNDGDFTVYSVKDNGDGFDDKLRSKLFIPFSRLHSENEFEGNGAGLAIVERIISKHGGIIWAEGKKGKGAIFSFKLPNE